MLRACPPVAMMTLRVWRLRVPPAFSVTWTSWADLSRAVPSTTSTLFLRISVPTPLTRRSDTLRLRSTAAPKSASTPRQAKAKFLALAQQRDDLGVAEERLGGDAAPVEAHAAQVLLFDQGDLEPQLRCADGGHVAARPRAKYYNVVCCFRHMVPPQAFLGLWRA